MEGLRVPLRSYAVSLKRPLYRIKKMRTNVSASYFWPKLNYVSLWRERVSQNRTVIGRGGLLWAVVRQRRAVMSSGEAEEGCYEQWWGREGLLWAVLRKRRAVMSSVGAEEGCYEQWWGREGLLWAVLRKRRGCYEQWWGRGGLLWAVVRERRAVMSSGEAEEDCYEQWWGREGLLWAPNQNFSSIYP